MESGGHLQFREQRYDNTQKNSPYIGAIVGTIIGVTCPNYQYVTLIFKHVVYIFMYRR